MTNTKLLLSKIKDSGLKLSFIANRLNMSRQSFNRRVYGRTEFKAPEIKELCNILNLSGIEKEKIFFA